MKLQRLLRFASLLFLLGIFVSVAHAYDFESGGIFYNITSTTNMTASVTYLSKTDNAYSGTVTIPASVTHDGKDYTITAIGEYAFVGCTSLDKVVFTSDHLKTIGNYAFSGCNGMTNVVIPKQITNIGNGAFNGCYGITGVTLEEGDETLNLGYNYYANGGGKGLFYDCPLYSVFIGRPLSYSTTGCGYSPFAQSTTLVKAHLGNPVKRIGNYLFYNCTALTTMVYNSQCKPTAVGEYTFSGCKSLTWDAVGLPESVTSIGEYAFRNCVNFTNLVIKPHITSIANFAFNGCTSITGVTIEESDITLKLGYNYYANGGGKGLFYDCPLTSVFIGRPLSYSTTGCGYSPFAQSTTLVKAHLGNPVKSIWNYLFYNCTALTTMVYNSLCKPTAVGEYTFSGCKSLTWDAVGLPESVTSIGEYAFRNCVNFTNLVIKPHITSIANFAFNGCTSITGVTIEESDATLALGYNYYANGGGRGLFYDCPLTSVFIGRPLSYSTTGCGYSPFAQSTTLVKAHLGNPVKRIGNYLFYNCTALKTMVYNSQCKPTAVGEYTFSGCKSLTWDAVGLPESVTSIGEYAFRNCVNFTNLVIKPHITSIANFAFNGCTSITGVTLEEGDETLALGYNYYANGGGKGLFYDCPLYSVFIGRPLSYSTTGCGYSPFAQSKTLVKAHLGNPVKRIGNYLFYNCTELTTMVYNSQCKPTAVGEYTFSGCKSLTWDAVGLPESVTSIGEYAFRNCVNFTNLVIKPHITSIANFAFNGCTSITGVTIEESDATLKLGYNYYANGGGKGLFYDCPLTSVFIGRPLSYSTTGCGYSPFAQSTTLVKAHLGNPVKSIWNYLFYNCTALTTMVYDSQCKPTAVGEYTFSGCKSLTWDAVGLPKSVTSIGEYAFRNCVNFTNLVIKPHITSIANFAFNGCTSITGVTLEEGDETLALGYNYYANGAGKGLFYDCPLTSVFIGRPLSYSTTGCGFSPFAQSKTLVKVHLGNPVMRIGNYLFYNCTALTTMVYDSQCKPTAVGNYTFYGCKSIVDGDSIIPATVTSIGERAFYGCSNLKTITIPDKVTSIGQYGIASCTELARVTSLATIPPTINENCFSTDTYNNATLIAYNASAYAKAVGWKLFLNVDDAGVQTEMTDAPKATVFDGAIRAEGHNIKVYNISGSLVGEGSEVPVNPGLYIVLMNGKSFKVFVK